MERVNRYYESLKILLEYFLAEEFPKYEFLIEIQESYFFTNAYIGLEIKVYEQGHETCNGFVNHYDMFTFYGSFYKNIHDYIRNFFEYELHSQCLKELNYQ